MKKILAILSLMMFVTSSAFAMGWLVKDGKADLGSNTPYYQCLDEVKADCKHLSYAENKKNYNDVAYRACTSPKNFQCGCDHPIEARGKENC